MPRLALALAILWLLTVFVLRTALQWWQTGSTGIKGVTGPVCSLSWSAGLFANLGVICSGIAPLGTIYGWLGGVPLFANDTLHITGAVLMLAGISGAFIAQLSMGDSWRIGVDESERTTLVTAGLFAWVRNPIFSFVLITSLGLILVLPTVLAVAAFLLLLASIEVQVRVVEEPYLTRTHGAPYRSYASRVGRFLPGRLRHRD